MDIKTSPSYTDKIFPAALQIMQTDQPPPTGEEMLEDICSELDRFALPKKLEIPNDRAIDNWMPLFTIAHVIGGGWPEKIQSSYFTLNSLEEEETAAVMMLRDIKYIFENKGKSKIFSRDLVSELINLEERPWCEWKKR